MIDLTKTENPSEHVRERGKKCWVKTLGPDSFLVKPKQKGKARRLVNFLTGSSGVRIECTDAVSGEPCPANAFRRHCGHAEAAINRLLANVKRQANKQLKEQRQG